MTVSAYEDVFGFEVSVDDASSMESFDTLNDFGGIETGAIPA